MMVELLEREPTDTKYQAAALVHHYYCREPTEGSDACSLCSELVAADLDGHGTMTVLIERLAATLAA
jgi:hypothetical protein